MAGQNLDYYLDNAEAFNALTDDDKARVFAGESLEGETVTADEATTESSAAPAAASETAAEPAAQEAEPKEEPPVVLAKDGKHTIPYQELESAREQARQWEQIAKDQAALVESLKAKPEPVAVAQEPQVIDIAELEGKVVDALMDGDRDTALALRTQINAELERRAEARAVSSVKQDLAERDAQQAAQDADARLHAVAARVVDSFPFLDSESSAANATAINEVVEWRDFYIAKGQSPDVALANAAAKIGPMYAPAKTAPPPANDAAAKAAAVVAQAKPKAPTSLSEIPAGAAAPHDEAAALREMTGVNLMQKFAGKTPEQIMELMSRVI